MPTKKIAKLLELASGAQVYDLGVELFPGMPHFPTHPPFIFGLTKRHGEVVTELPDGRSVSASAESIALGTHVGTHIDGVGHFSCNGMLFGGLAASGQSHTGGLPAHGMELVEPIIRRGVMLDIAGLEGVAILDPDFTIRPAHLESASLQQEIEIGAGDVVLLRTGWARHWPDPSSYITAGRGNVPTSPGPGLEAAEWLSARNVFATGSDTVVFEKAPSTLPVHVHLLVEKGIHIIEVLNLEELARDRISEFLFAALPLKIRGATGSPIRPVAICV